MPFFNPQKQVTLTLVTPLCNSTGKEPFKIETSTDVAPECNKTGKPVESNCQDGTPLATLKA
jgi:hypothetical protein